MRLPINKNGAQVQTLALTKYSKCEFTYSPNQRKDVVHRIILRVDPIAPDVLMHPFDHDRFVQLPKRPIK